MLDSVKNRHAVRSYTDKKIEGETKQELENLISEINANEKLDFRLILNEPQAFNSHYGSFKNANNYIVLAGDKSISNLEEKCGYFGEKIVLKAQELVLNTCWVAVTYDKKKIPFDIPKNEKLVIVIAIGYGENQGVPHKMKSIEDISKTKGEFPDWYKNGLEYVLYAPSAINQQKIKFELLDGNKVRAIKGIGMYLNVDLGIAKYHFELGAGKDNFEWDK